MKKRLIFTVSIALMSLYSVSTQAQWNASSLTDPLYSTTNSSIGFGTSTPRGAFEIRKPDATVYVTASNADNLTGTPAIYINRITEGLKLEYIPNVLARISNTFMGESGNIAFSTWGKDRMTILGTGNIGIGTTAPRANFEVRTNDATLYVTADNAIAGGVGNPSLYINRITEGLKLEYVPNVLARISNTFVSDNVGHLALNTKGVDRLIITGNGNVGIGTSIAGIYTNNTPGYKLAVNGTIGAREVVVETSSAVWADYVFDKDYSLTPLDRVAEFVKVNKHLPEIPSAADVERDGHRLGEMDVLLLKKVEELTLYMIELKKENDVLRQETEKLKIQNQQLSRRVSGLEKK